MDVACSEWASTCVTMAPAPSQCKWADFMTLCYLHVLAWFPGSQWKMGSHTFLDTVALESGLIYTVLQHISGGVQMWHLVAILVNLVNKDLVCSNKLIQFVSQLWESMNLFFKYFQWCCILQVNIKVQTFAICHTDLCINCVHRLHHLFWQTQQDTGRTLGLVDSVSKDVNTQGEHTTDAIMCTLEHQHSHNQVASLQFILCIITVHTTLHTGLT